MNKKSEQKYFTHEKKPLAVGKYTSSTWQLKV